MKIPVEFFSHDDHARIEGKKRVGEGGSKISFSDCNFTVTVSQLTFDNNSPNISLNKRKETIIPQTRKMFFILSLFGLEFQFQPPYEGHQYLRPLENSIHPIQC